MTGCPVRVGGIGEYVVRGPSGPVVQPTNNPNQQQPAPTSNIRVMATFLRDPSRDETNRRSTPDRQFQPLDNKWEQMCLDAVQGD